MSLEKIIVALDTDMKEEAIEIIHKLGDRINYYKVGSVLFTRYGPELVKEIKKFGQGKQVFLDLKYHDIPNTVANAIKQAMIYGVDMLTIHTIGGYQMMRAAVEACGKEQKSKPPVILGVTVLTSMKTTDLREVGVNRVVESQVKKMTKLGMRAGIGGVVCSGQEIELVRKVVGEDKLIVVPGIRLASGDKGDQKRVVTPKDAVLKGADYLVMGRPIIKANDPQKILDLIEQELNGVS
ncbi:MAG: orotidine-5'-phosphate decarboxylase [bacterium]|nr:orotidine-5'-phosphate decarboxylase [bacterium]